MKQKLYRKIKLAGIPIKVVFDTLPADQYGECDPDERTITISNKVTDKKLIERILKHEKIHMVLGLTGLSELLDHNLEEAIVIAMENLL